MKAGVLRELGGPHQLQYEDVNMPVLKSNEVLVRLKYASLNRRDVWITYGLYPGLKLPSILGADGAGEVVAIGDKVEGIKGSHVIKPFLLVKQKKLSCIWKKVKTLVRFYWRYLKEI